MLKNFFNEQLNIKEAHELPDRLMSTLMDKNTKTNLFNAFVDSGLTTDVDTMNEFFQSEHSDRNSFMQDFTPSSITKVVNTIVGKQHTIADICGGVGGLSNQLEYENIYIEELSKRAVPLLLFVLAIRNKKAIVWNGDSLTRECSAIYKLTPTDKYSNIELTDEAPEQFDAVVSNPPYSLKWDDKSLQNDSRFIHYPTAPKSKADFAFILHCLSKLNDNGTLAVVLPHGVLFRGGKEGAIRKQLIDENLIDSVIGMPGNMFYNTQIPTVILVLKKNRENKDILFIDSSKECTKNGRFNYLNEEQLEKIKYVYQSRFKIEKFSEIVAIEDIKANDYNLNIPRYVDTYETEDVPDLIEVLKELNQLDEEIKKSEIKMFSFFDDLVGIDEKEQQKIEQAKELTKRWLNEA